jgi:glycosyltransferase involved in cell wall biosynthesis
MSKKFTVLMSVYHKENPEHFDLALHHILEEQTLLPNEFILVCDGPLNEELYAVIEKYSIAFPEVLKIFKLEKNGGLGKALNFGLEKCTYEFVARADSDDICAKNRFECQISYMEERPKLAAVGSDIQEFLTDIEHPTAYKKMPSTNAEVYEMAKFRNPLNHMTVMFRKSMVKNVGSYKHLQYVEDYYLWIRLLVAGYEIENINEPLVYARVGNGMVQRRGSKSYIGSWRTQGKYMLEHVMITKMQYLKNMIAVRFFVYMPVGLKQFVYKNILRRKK